jgi:hypothetical protein
MTDELSSSKELRSRNNYSFDYFSDYFDFPLFKKPLLDNGFHIRIYSSTNNPTLAGLASGA